jgi:hypothetical protein
MQQTGQNGEMGAMSLFTTKGRRKKKKRRIPDDAFYASEEASAKTSKEASAEAITETSAKKDADGKVLAKLDTKRTGKSISGSALMGKASLMVALGLVLLMGIGYLLTLLFSRRSDLRTLPQSSTRSA